MNEEKRLKKITKINQKREKIKELKNMKKELALLENSEQVKRYLNIKEKVENTKIISFREIIRKEFEKKEIECPHDIYFSLGGRKDAIRLMHYEPSTYYAFGDDIEYYLYCCLECHEVIEIQKYENEDFKKNNKVVESNHKIVDFSDYRKCQDIYFNLLYKNTTEKAYQRLIKNELYSNVKK